MSTTMARLATPFQSLCLGDAGCPMRQFQHQLGGTTVGVRTTSWLIFAVIFSYVGPLSAQGTAGSGYHKAQEIVLGGEGGWDYLTLDAVARRLYISRAAQVVVVDPDSGKVIGTIADTPGVHGIAVA